MTTTTFDDRDALYGALLDHHLRIGDSQFYVPPTAITVTRKMKNHKINVLRGRGSFIKSNGYFDLIIEINLFFPDMVSINGELRPLLAQLKKCPFLPIENTLLNNVYDIEAVTVSGVSVTSVEGFPHALQAQLQLYKFNPFSYIYDESGRSFDEMFNWPLFRWYYQRNLFPDEHPELKRFATYYEPLQNELYNEYMFRIASEEDLKKMENWRIQRDKIIKKWMDEKGAGLANNSRDYTMIAGIPIPDGLFTSEVTDEIIEGVFNGKIEDLDKKLLDEYDIFMENWDIPGLILESISVGYENTITSVQLQMHESPTHQYMGSQDTIIIAKFSTDDEDALASLEQFVRRSTYLNRMYHQYISNGFIQFDHQLLRLFGINYVVIEDMVSSTREGFPGVYDITLTMTSYNRAQKKLAETEWLSEKAKSHIPDNAFPYIFDAPIFKDFQDQGSIESLDVKQKAIYDAKVKQMFTIMELYPDLELPTYKEVEQAGFKIPNLNGGEFVDPDFFIIYNDPIDIGEELTKVLSDTKNTHLRDSMNDNAFVTAANIVLDEKTQKAVQKEKEQNNPKPIANNYGGQSDYENLSTSDTETMIRKIANDYGVPQELAVALAKTFDPKLRQFYSVGKGANKDLGNVEVTESNIPVMLSSRNQYYTDKNFLREAAYIGVMRVSPLMGNPEQIGNSIEQNIEVGIITLKYYLDQVENEKLVNHYTLSAFGLGDGSQDAVKGQWAGAICKYLGFAREYNQLFSNNKKMTSSITGLVNKVLQTSDQVGKKSSQQIQNAFQQIPVPDYKKANANSGSYSFQEKIHKEQDYSNLNTVFQEHFHDMKKYDRRGRLVRAFPTFFLVFIDEGQFIGTVKLSDQFFGYRAVTDISFTNNRKVASSTAVIEMCNVFGNLTDAAKGVDLTHTSLMDLLNVLLSPGDLAREVERSRHRDPNWYKSIYLRTGARVHLRMGYGSNPLNMPTTIKGSITSIQNNGETVTVIVQDDGIELTHKLKASPDDQTRTFFFSSKEPTAIVDELLTDHQNWFLDKWANISNAEYLKHSLGIMHFGLPGKPISHYWWDFTELQDRPINEITMNVYSTTGKLRYEANGLFAKLGNFFGIGDNDEDGININLYDKSVWDVLSTVSLVGEDMILAVHPFDFRNTIFLGKPYFPLGYEYLVDGDNVQTINKPFRQYHVYDSFTSIIDNSITATEENMYTVAIGVFNNEGSMDTTSAIYVDTNIWPEKQKTVQVDTHLNVQGVRLIEHIPLIGHFLNKPFKWYFDEWTAIKIAAASLRDYVKEMYDGYLTVMGDPSVKPFDQVYFYDAFINMNGPIEVREVNQLMNFEVGFITMIKPDCVVVNSDKTSVSFLHSGISIFSHVIAVNTLRNVLRNRGYEGSYPIINATWASVKRQWSKLTGKFDFTQKIIDSFKVKKAGPASTGGTIFEYDPMTGEVREFAPVSSQMKQRWEKSGLLKDFAKNLKDFTVNGLKDLYESAGKSIAGKSVLGYDISKLGKLRGNMSSLMKTGKVGNVLKWGRRGAAAVIGGTELLMGPPGWLALLIETMVTETLLAGIREFIDRWTYTRKAVIITTLQKDGIEFSAGINGHMGSVVGDSPDAWQAFLKSWAGELLLGFLGSDAANYGINGMKGEANAVNQSMDTFITNFINAHRKRVIYDPEVEKRYELDKQDAQKELNDKKKADDDLVNKIAQYGEETRKLFSLDTLTNWIKSIFNSLIGGGDGGEGVDPSSFVTMDLNIPSGISAEAIDKAFAGTGLAGTGKYYVQLEKSIPAAPSPMLNITDGSLVPPTSGRVMNGLYLAAHSAWETGYGKSRIFRDKHNLFGYGAYDNDPYNSAYTFRSVEDCIYYAANKIKDNYLTKGGKFYHGPTLRGMNVSYATDKSWADGIAGIMAKIAKYDPNFKMPGSVGHAKTSGEIPTVVGRAGKDKYHIASASEAAKILLNLKSLNLQHVKLTMVTPYPYIRQASYDMIEALGAAYKAKTGETICITSTYREGDPDWHGTGFAVDVDTPDCGIIAGSYRFPKGSKNKQNLATLIDCAVQVGFGGIIHADVDVIADMQKKYPNVLFQQRNDHYNH